MPIGNHGVTAQGAPHQAAPIPVCGVDLRLQLREFFSALEFAETDRTTALFTAVCPIHRPRRHRLIADFANDFTGLRICCPVCEETPAGRAALEVRLREILPAWPRWLYDADDFRPVSGWQRQADGRAVRLFRCPEGREVVVVVER